MKRFVFCILAMVIISGLLITGCGGETTTTTTSTSQTSVTTSSQPATTTSTTKTTTTTTSSPSPTPTSTKKTGGILKVLDMRLPAASLGWPAKMATDGTYFLQAAVETLFRTDINSQPVPFLATGYKLADDMSSMTIDLRKGVKFHDGTAFDAEACKYNLEAVKAAGVAGTTGWSSIEVVDADTVKINITTWENLMLGNLAGMAGMMVSPTAIEANGVEWATTNIVATGPFKLAKFERDTILEFVKNEDYWQEGKPYLDRIQYICIPDPMTQVATFKVGDADLLQPWSGMVLGEMKQMPGIEFIYSHSGTFVIYPDDANPDSPLANKLVREAIEHAINKEALMAVSGFGVFEAAYQVPVPGAVGYLDDITPRMYDPDKAKQLLTEAGYPDGFECTLTITIPAPDIQDSQVAIQGFLADVGITCNLEYADPAKYSDYMSTGWHATMIYSPSYAAGNYLSSVQTYYTIPGYYVSLKGPANLMELYNAAIKAPEVDAALVEAVTRALWEEDSLIPVSYMGTGQVMQAYVKDTGFGLWASQMNFSPEDYWLDK